MKEVQETIDKPVKHGFLIRVMPLEIRAALRIEAAKRYMSMTDYLIWTLQKDLIKKDHKKCRDFMPTIRK